MEKSNNSTFEMIKLGLILAIYAAISCVVLAIVNNVTAPKIQQVKSFLTIQHFP